MSTLKQVRDDIATVVASVLSIDAFGGWRGQVEPQTARVVPAADNYRNRRGETASFGTTEVTFSVLVFVPGTDLEAAEDALNGYADLLETGLGGQTLANGGICPPVAETAGPAMFTAPGNQDTSKLLHGATTLVALPFQITT